MNYIAFKRLKIDQNYLQDICRKIVKLCLRALTKQYRSYIQKI